VEGEQLLLIDVVNAHGVVVLQTVWAPAGDLRFGRRLTRSERIADQAQLIGRLEELLPLIAGHLVHSARMSRKAKGAVHGETSV
jgi:hypothetical protein